MSWRSRLAASPAAPAAAFVMRARSAGRYNASILARSARWTVRAREHTNYTYDLEPLNRQHLAWFVAHLAPCSVEDAERYFNELETDATIRATVDRARRDSPRRSLIEPVPRWHKRLGWYALVRARQPQHVVETGTDKGLGTVVLAAAVARNGVGRVTTIDVNTSAGSLLAGNTLVNRIVGDSLTVLGGLSGVDMFIHDSLHTREHEIGEFDAVAPHLTDSALILSDNAHVTDALPSWAQRTNRSFLYWQERPANHWYPGGGIGAAWSR